MIKYIFTQLINIYILQSKNAMIMITEKEWSVLAADELNSDSLAVKKH